MIVTAAIGGAAVISVVPLMKLASVWGVGIRYALPIFIAAVPVMALLQSGTSYRSVFRIPDTREGGSIIALGSAFIVILALFSDVLADRVKLALDKRTMLSYPIDDYYVRDMRRSMGEGTREWTRRIQLLSEPNQTIIVWISTPFHLDFQRNKIFSVGMVGVVWPEGIKTRIGDSAGFSEYLRSLNVRYVMWEYRGPPKQRSPSNATLSAFFRDMKRRGRILFDDEGIVLFEIELGESR